MHLYIWICIFIMNQFLVLGLHRKPEKSESKKNESSKGPYFPGTYPHIGVLEHPTGHFLGR